jgi:hypothetical protein
VCSAGQPFSKSCASNCYVSRGACQISTRFMVVLEDDESATCFWHADSEHIHRCTTGAMFYLQAFFPFFLWQQFLPIGSNRYDCFQKLSLWLELWSCMMFLLFWLVCVLTNGLYSVQEDLWWSVFPIGTEVCSHPFFFAMCMLVVRTWTYYIA